MTTAEKLKASANVTLHDVARVAGVSHTTVSWALRDDPRITAATRERVMAAAQNLGYVPNEVARSLARGRTHTLAIVSSSFSCAFDAEALRGIEAEIREHHPGFALVQHSTGGIPEHAGAIYDHLLRANKADAVISFAESPSSAQYQSYRTAGKALVVFDENAQGMAAIRGDSQHGSTLAALHLLEAGCRKPGIISSLKLDNGRLKCNPDRLSTFTRVCAEHGRPAEALAIDQFHFDSGKTLAQTLIEHQWDGVFCAAGDMVAIGILAGLRERGVRVPHDLRVVGYDNLQISAMVQPPLTTIAQPMEAMGREAVRMCFALLARGTDNTAPPPQQTFAPTLIRRDSA